MPSEQTVKCAVGVDILTSYNAPSLKYHIQGRASMPLAENEVVIFREYLFIESRYDVHDRKGRGDMPFSRFSNHLHDPSAEGFICDGHERKTSPESLNRHQRLTRLR